MSNEWLLIGVLAVMTYLSRFLGVEVMAGRKMSPTLHLYFNYVPVAIITALIVKQIFIPSAGHLAVSFPVLISCLIAAIAVRLTRLFLPSVVIGIVIGLLVRYLL